MAEVRAGKCMVYWHANGKQIPVRVLARSSGRDGVRWKVERLDVSEATLKHTRVLRVCADSLIDQ